jgi:hypothetical protein
VSSDDDGLDPTGDRFRYPLNDDRFTEDGSIEDVSDLTNGIEKSTPAASNRSAKTFSTEDEQRMMASIA